MSVHVLRLGPAVTEAERARVLDWGRRLLAATRSDATWAPATKTGFGKIVGVPDYVGFHMFFRSDRIPKADIHMYVTHPAGHLAVVEQPESAVYLLSYQNASLEKDGGIAAGWDYGKDRTGHQGYRRLLRLTDLGWAADSEPAIDDVLPQFTEWIRESLTRHRGRGLTRAAQAGLTFVSRARMTPCTGVRHGLRAPDPDCSLRRGAHGRACQLRHVRERRAVGHDQVVERGVLIDSVEGAHASRGIVTR